MALELFKPFIIRELINRKTQLLNQQEECLKEGMRKFGIYLKVTKPSYPFEQSSYASQARHTGF